MDLIRLLNGAATATDAATGEAATVQQLLVTFIPLVLMLGVFYFLLIRPEKKRAKKMKEMLDNLQVADEVVTTGGIIRRYSFTRNRKRQNTYPYLKKLYRREQNRSRRSRNP